MRKAFWKAFKFSISDHRSGFNANTFFFFFFCCVAQDGLELLSLSDPPEKLRLQVCTTQLPCVQFLTYKTCLSFN
jgi:hypothetical protein